MVLVRSILYLLSLPLEWAGQLAGMLKLPVRPALLTAAWTVSGNGRTAREALVAIYQMQGSESALVQGLDWMTRRPRPEIAAFTGLVAMEHGQTQQAVEMFQRGHELGDDPDGLLDVLELNLASQGAGGLDAAEVARRFSTRRDLPSSVTRAIQFRLMWDDLWAGRFDSAEAQARRLLAIEEQGEAQMVLWAVACHRGDQAEADRHWQQAKLKNATKLYLQILALAALGRADEARQQLAGLRDLDASSAERAEAALAKREGLA